MTTHAPECWKNQALLELGVGGPLASCTCGAALDAEGEAMNDMTPDTLRRWLRRNLGWGQALGYAEGSAHADAWEATDRRLAALETALQGIATWSDAYPLDVFLEPDFKKAHEVLKAAGMTLDAISASSIRHVVEGVGKIAKSALAAGKEKP